MSAPKPHLVYALEYPIAFGGGVSVIVRTLMAALRGEYRLSLVSPDSAADLHAAGVAPMLENHLPWTLERASAARARELAGKLRAWQPWLVHFHSGGNFGWGNRRPFTSPIPLLRAAGVKCLSTVHLIVSPLSGVLAPESPWWVRAAAGPVAWLGKMHALSGTAVEVAVSDHDLARLRQWYSPMRGKFRRIYHSRLAEAPPPAPHAREPVILHAGHRAERKGQHILVEAFARVAAEFPEWRLHLVGPPGDEPFERRLAEIVSSSGLVARVQIDGSRPDATALMERAMVYVQPSLQEALGLALQEALYHGCACIGARAGGIPELIADDSNGLLVPAGDAAAMAAALRKLLADAVLRARFAGGGRPSVLERGMTAEAMVRAHRELYAEVCDAR